MHRHLKRLGVGAFLFFLIKGLAWLAVLTAASVWAGSDRSTAQADGPASQSELGVAGGEGGAGGPARGLPMGLNTLAEAAARGWQGWSNAGVWTNRASATALGLAGVATLAAVAAKVCRGGQRRTGGSIVSIRCSTAGRTARAASLRPCV
jgi:hypothetical protein